MIFGKIIITCLLVTVCLAREGAAQDPVVVGSKKFNESYILAEIMAQLLEDSGLAVDRKYGLGGTLVCYQALKSTEIDVYPEYSGTIEQAILRSAERKSFESLAKELRSEHGLVLLDPFGFDNTYAIAVKGVKADELELETIGDLADLPGLRFAFSHEFLERQDGWPGLAKTYGLTAKPRGIEHGLAYQAIDDNKIDVTDVYSTDGDVEKYGLVLLTDDLEYFPQYLAAPLTHALLDTEIRSLLNRIAGMITSAEMRRLNSRVLLHGESFAEVASGFLEQRGFVAGSVAKVNNDFWRTLVRRTAIHLKLTVIALIAGMLVAMPLGVLIYRMDRLARPVVYVAGILQTVPSIALLALMIPLFGIGAVPAIIALFLYALLPILRNTATALFSIDPILRKVAVGMGLTGGQRLRHIEIPLAAATILAGIKTAAVINIGTATLAAFIGAGGLGEPIVTGLALNDTGLILEGAIPAALLAVLTELVFEGIERLMIPRHL
ncbi:MAG: ABC transporter permease subunit, partial [Candidatus Krumholzibacteria bacterium]|nr:ABC transporter permease subunit [Candidatus Krumholzibacteria bacterium]